MSNGELGSERVKHLELIQDVVRRLAGNSFVIKGWAITLAVALVGFAIQLREPTLALTSMIPTLLFWGLDAYYLRAERLFRALYDRARVKKVEPFFLGATGKAFVSALKEGGSNTERTAASRIRSFLSVTLIPFYLILISAGAVAANYVCSLQDSEANRQQKEPTREASGLSCAGLSDVIADMFS